MNNYWGDQSDTRVKTEPLVNTTSRCITMNLHKSSCIVKNHQALHNNLLIIVSSVRPTELGGCRSAACMISSQQKYRIQPGKDISQLTMWTFHQLCQFLMLSIAIHPIASSSMHNSATSVLASYISYISSVPIVSSPYNIDDLTIILWNFYLGFLTFPHVR